MAILLSTLLSTVKESSTMSTLIAYLTEQTCGESCWHAREDICRCSCNGKNHGCLRDSGGERPVRSSRIDGYMYQLHAVGYDVADIGDKMNEDSNLYGIYTYNTARSRDKMYIGAPAKARYATQSQVDRWPELAAYRGLDLYFNCPTLLWVRV